MTDRSDAVSAHSMALQRDGGIVLVGWNRQYDLTVARFLPNGRLDHTFGQHGVAVVPRSIGGSVGRDVEVQRNGKIVIVSQGSIDDQTAIVLVRLRTNGTLDPYFGSNGATQTTIGRNSAPTSLALQADGKIVVGSYVYPLDYDMALVRYNSDGTLDVGFGTNGVAQFGAGGQESVQDVVVQGDGKILAVGGSASLETGYRRFLIARFDENGQTDLTFSGDGYTLSSIGESGDSIASAVALQRDGRAVVGGVSHDLEGSPEFAVARYHTATGE